MYEKPGSVERKRAMDKIFNERKVNLPSFLKAKVHKSAKSRIRKIIFKIDFSPKLLKSVTFKKVRV